MLTMTTKCSLVVIFVILASASVCLVRNFQLLINAAEVVSGYSEPTEDVDVLPKRRKVSFCDDLDDLLKLSTNPNEPPKTPTNSEDPYKIKQVDGFKLSYLYTNLLSVFESAIADTDRDNPEWIEGHSGQFPEMTSALHYLTGLDFVRTVCETGFNYGHSSFAYLTAKSDSKVHSFDLANHHYAIVMTSFLNRIFPHRLFVHFGNSNYTIPEYIVGNPGFQCDLMLVDGGHDYDLAKADLTHFASVANPDNNVIMLDDYPTDWGTTFGRAWEEMIDSRKIKELLRCRKRDRTSGLERGFVVGRVMK